MRWTWSRAQAGADKNAADNSTAGRIRRREPLAQQRVAPGRLLRHGGASARRDGRRSRGWRGVMLTFDDFVIGVEQFGQRIQPLMQQPRYACRQAREGGADLDSPCPPVRGGGWRGRSSTWSCAASASAMAISPPSTASRSRSRRGSSSACWARRAAARPPPCAASPAWKSPTTAAS